MTTLSNVTIKDPHGDVCKTALPSNLEGCKIEFDVTGPTNGDVYRVEVFPDPAADAIPDHLEEIPAGVHITDPQHFSVFLTRTARHEFELTLYKVDAKTAGRDSNEDAPVLWRQTYTVR
jgi:hypothetical protein